MSDISDWIQSNWFEVGNLILQFATLAALMWFARSLLKIAATSQRHAGAPERVTAPPIHPASEAAQFNSALRGLIPMDPGPSQPQARAPYVGSADSSLSDSIVKEMNTPMGNAPVAWRRMGIRRVS